MKKFFMLFLLGLTFSALGQEAANIALHKAELEKMFETDQSHRLEVIELEKKHGKDSVEVKEAWAKQETIDSHNIKRLEEIIAIHGWPTRTQFGNHAVMAAFLILQHSDLSYQKKYLPLVREAVAKREMHGVNLAYLEDRVRVREGRKQLYGSQVTRNDADEWEPLALEAPDNVDALRATVGLGPISEYLHGFASQRGGRVSAKWMKKTEPNKAPEPTTTSVTPRAP